MSAAALRMSLHYPSSLRPCCSPVGFFCVTPAAKTPCAAGFFGDSPGQFNATCAGPCAAGWFCPSGSTNATAVVCPPGSYCEAGAAAPVLCPAGTFGDTPGLETASCSGECALCGAGATAFISSSQSASASASESSTPSPLPSLSQSGSRSQSSSATLTRGPTASATASPSRSTSPSLTSTHSQRPSGSQRTTPSQQPTPPSSRTQTPSLGASLSPAPYALALSMGGAAAADSLLLSDSLPPVTLAPTLSRCPAPLSVTVACGLSSVVSGSAASEGSPTSIITSYLPSPSCMLACSGDASTVLPLSIQLQAPFGTASFSGTLVCNASGSDGGGLGSLGLAASVMGSLWPTFDDAIVVFGNGVSRSIGGFGSGAANSTSDLLLALDEQRLHAPPDAPPHRRAGSMGRALTADDLGNAIADLSVVLAAMQRSWGGVPIPPSASAAPFGVTLSGATPLVLRSLQRSFVDGTSVWVGGVMCNATVVSADGMWLATLTPSFSRLCGTLDPASDSSCAYATLTVRVRLGRVHHVPARTAPSLCPRATMQNPSLVNASSSNGSSPTAASRYQGIRGVTLTCPPFCSGAVSGGVFPLAATAAGATPVLFVPATRGADGSAVPLDLTLGSAGESIGKSSGLFYAEACSASGAHSGVDCFARSLRTRCPQNTACPRSSFHRSTHSGIYTNPGTGACANASDPAAAACAYGAGDSCVACPANALCPGGFRAWPARGYWSPAEASATVVPCAIPGAADRCLGWSSALGAVQCGSGYLQGSYLCGACERGFFLSGDGTCGACPVSPSLWVQFRGLFILISIVAAFSLVVYVTFWVGALTAGLSPRVDARVRVCRR